MGLYKRGDVYYASGVDHRGKRWITSTRQRDLAAARVVARKLAAERAVASDRSPAHSLTACMTALVEHMQAMGRADGTLKFAKTKAGHVLRCLDPRRDVTTLTSADGLAYMRQRLSETASRHTVRHELGVLRSAVRLAQRAGTVPRDVDAAALLPHELRGAYVPRRAWLTRAELAQLVMHVSPSLRDYVLALAHTGCRWSELLALRATHIEGEWLRIPGTKTARSRRRIPIDDTARAVLERRVASAGNGPLFPERRNVTRDLAAAAKRGGVPVVTPNDLRRTYATWHVQAGAPLTVVARMLGHGSTRMLDAVYAQVDDSAMLAAAQMASGGKLEQTVKRAMAINAERPRRK